MKILKIVKTAAQAGAAAALVTVFHSSPSQALSFTANLMDFTGDTAAGSITIEDLVGGGVRFSASITEPTINGDIATVAFLVEPSFLDSLSINNFTSNLGDSLDYSLITGSSVCSKQDTVFNGGGSPCREDQQLNVALDFGKGSSDGLLQSLSFEISDLTTSDFVEAFGLRYQSTGTGMGGSSKLGYYYPGYMGTTSQVFYLDENQAPPEGAVPVDEQPEVQAPDEIRVNGKWKKKNKK